MSALPTYIGTYKLLRKIGEGGMGAVYEALQETIERRVAIKILQAEYARNAEITKRFFNEARAVNRIDHPSLVQIHEHGHLPEGTAYIVMEFLKGVTLAQRMRQLGGRVPEQLALQIAWQVATALTAAHDKAIVHRDLKPANLMLVPDPLGPGGERVKVLDFGIAKLVAEAHQGRTAGSLVMGTPAYMSPEQCRGAGAVDEKTDVYSLGIILFEMLVGRPPFVAAGAGELLGMQLFQPVPSILELAPDVHPDTAAFTQALLSKERTQRPSMREVAQHLAPHTLLAAAPRARPVPTAPNNLLQAQEPATVSMADPNLLPCKTAVHSGPSGSMPIVGDQHVSEVPARPLLRRALLSSGVLAALGLAWTLAASTRPISAIGVSNHETGTPGLITATNFANESPSNRLDPETVDAPGQTDPIGADSEMSPPDMSDVHQAATGRKPATARQREHSIDHRRKGPAPPLSTPPPVDGRTPLDNLLQAAQEEYDHGSYRQTIRWAQFAQKERPDAAWLLTGQAACHLKDIALADEAYKYLKTGPLQNLLETCLKQGVEHRQGGFTVGR